MLLCLLIHPTLSQSLSSISNTPSLCSISLTPSLSSISLTPSLSSISITPYLTQPPVSSLDIHHTVHSLGRFESEQLRDVLAHVRATKKVQLLPLVALVSRLLSQVSAIALWGRSMGAVTALIYTVQDQSIAVSFPHPCRARLTNHDLAGSYLGFGILLSDSVDDRGTALVALRLEFWSCISQSS